MLVCINKFLSNHFLRITNNYKIIFAKFNKNINHQIISSLPFPLYTILIRPIADKLGRSERYVEILILNQKINTYINFNRTNVPWNWSTYEYSFTLTWMWCLITAARSINIWEFLAYCLPIDSDFLKVVLRWSTSLAYNIYEESNQNLVTRYPGSCYKRETLQGRINKIQGTCENKHYKWEIIIIVSFITRFSFTKIFKST